ncbi:MAG: hypothetical protein K6G52_00970 [Treponemataceae bacterium]|nr:hypothetical protein [Treponemataceae bacterium]
MKRSISKKFVLYLILLFVASSVFAQQAVDFEIDPDEVPKWVTELFVKNNEKYAYKKFKINENDVIFYGAAEGEDVEAVKTLARLNVDKMAMDKFSKALGSTVFGARLNGMEQVCENTVELFDEDGNVTYQVFSVYKIKREYWEKNISVHKQLHKQLMLP